MRRENALLLYRTVFLPKVLYGAEIWAAPVLRQNEIKTLATIQRPALIAISSAYRTAPTVGLQVIMGTLPLVLEAIWLVAKSSTKTLPSPEQEQLRSIKWDELVGVWQDRWNRTPKAQWTKRFIPSIKERLKKPLWINHFLVQI